MRALSRPRPQPVSPGPRRAPPSPALSSAKNVMFIALRLSGHRGKAWRRGPRARWRALRSCWHDRDGMSPPCQSACRSPRWLAMSRWTVTTTRHASTSSRRRASRSTARPTSSAGFALRSVLDAGCGTGRVALELVRRGLEVVGVDLDASNAEHRLEAGAPDRFVERTSPNCSSGAASTWSSWQATCSCSRRREPSRRSCSGAARHLGATVRSSSAAGPGPRLPPRRPRRRPRAGLVLAERWATWNRRSSRSDTRAPGRCYAVSVHRRLAATAMADPHCELCEAAHLTTWYHSDEVCWIADCEKIYNVPMVVWSRHGATTT